MAILLIFPFRDQLLLLDTVLRSITNWNFSVCYSKKLQDKRASNSLLSLFCLSLKSLLCSLYRESYSLIAPLSLPSTSEIARKLVTCSLMNFSILVAVDLFRLSNFSVISPAFTKLYKWPSKSLKKCQLVVQ